MSKKNKKIKNPPAPVTWINTVCGITGISLNVILNILSVNKNYIIMISILTVIATVMISVFVFRKQASKSQTDMNHKDSELKEKNILIEKLDQTIKMLGIQVDELNDRITACKKALIDHIKLTPVDHYLIDKDVYDEFRTDLKISDCVLEVELVKTKEHPEKYSLQFQWKLTVINSGSKPVCMARFIYSGEDNIDSNLTISTEGVQFEKNSIRTDIKVLGDDRFIEIDFADELISGDNAVIYINYTFEKYEFQRENDCIWLVPDALGFADMNRFCIRFYCDGEIVHAKTKVELKSYRLKGEYRLERERTIKYQKLEHDKCGYEAKSGKREQLHGYGYLLELHNTKSD